RCGGTEEIEHAHGGEQRSTGDLGEAVVHARRNEVRADQSVGRGAADEIGGGEQPEVFDARAIAQRGERERNRVCGGSRGGARLDGPPTKAPAPPPKDGGGTTHQ